MPCRDHTRKAQSIIKTELFFVYETPSVSACLIGINRHLIFYMSHSVQFVGVITAVFSTS